MAQTFETWTDETAARDVVYDKTKTNFETIRSSWSGTSFPENPVVGQPCYRTDEDKLYYWNGTEWGEKGGGSDQSGGLPIGSVILMPFGVDESENKFRYLNGQVIIQSQFVAFTNKVKAAIALFPSLSATEENWQAEKTNSKLGQCGKFVVDDTAGTIRLPCVVNAQGLVDLALIGEIKSESLPNITGSLYNTQNTYQDMGMDSATASGAISVVTDSNQRMSSANIQGYTSNILGWNFDASRSSSTYQNNAPVQQEAVQYPYCIVVNTGVEEAERPINNYQVNNVYSYGMSKYYKGTMNNNSWLRSQGQWNDGTVYTGMYNWLLEQRNADSKTMYGWHMTTDNEIQFRTLTNTLSVGTEIYGFTPTFKVGTVTAISGNDVTIAITIYGITDTLPISVSDPVSMGVVYIYDVSKTNVITKSELDNWDGPISPSDYDFVINTADQTFKLPLLNGSEDIVGDRLDHLVPGGDGTPYTAPANGWFAISGKPTANGGYCILDTNNYQPSYMTTNDRGWYDRGFIPVQRGQIVTLRYGNYEIESDRFKFIYAKGNGNLYYYVGDTLQNADLINIARIEEKLTDVNAASRGYVDESYHNGTEWYRIYSDGWCEQGGFAAPVSADGHACTVTFLKPFLDTSYGFFKINQTTSNVADYLFTGSYSSKTNTSIKIYNFNTYVSGASWFACGYIS